MILQQRIAKHLLLLVCLLLLNCAAQPLARLALLDQALSCQALPVQNSTTDLGDAKPASPQPGSCQLNGKWLSAAPLLCIEQLFFAVAMLIALLAPPLALHSATAPTQSHLATRTASAPHPLHLAGMIPALCHWS